MQSGITVVELFNAARLQPFGPVPWGCPVMEKKPGVYVVAIVPASHEDCDPVDFSYLPAETAAHWVEAQPVVYIGRTERSLACRISEFYSHVRGKRSPHHGGEDVLLLRCPRWVYWCPTEDFVGAEDKMIEYFKTRVDRLPFANRKRSSRANKDSRNR